MHRTALLTTKALALVFILAAPAAAQNLIDVPSQSLSKALSELGQETGLQVLAPAQTVEGKTSAPVYGSMTPKAALAQMLVGTGLTFRMPDENGAIVSRNDVVTQNETGTFDLGTILLRGELIERSVQDSQTSAVIVPGEELDARGETNLSQVINRTPGVNVSVTNVVIRGVNSAGTGVGTGNVASTITTSIDGIRVSDFQDVSETDLSTWDLEQVEILRGAQSTQSGRNALFGAVVLQSSDPQYTEEARLRFSIGNYESYQVALLANTVLIEDKLALRFSVDHRETGGFLNNQMGTNDRAAFTEVRTWRLGVRYDPTDRLSAVFKYTFIEDRGASIRALSPLLPARISRSEDDRQHDIHSWNADLSFDLTDTLTLTSNTIYTTANPTTDRVFLSGTQKRQRSYEVFEQEVRLAFENDRTRAVVGAFYTKIDDEFLDSQVQPASRLLRPPFPLSPNATITSTINEFRETENYAIFGEIEYDISPSWTVLAGARYDVEEFSASAFDQVFINDLGVTTPLPAISDPNTGNRFEAFLPNLGIIYRFDDDRSLGLTYKRGYRAGGSGINLGPLISGGQARVFNFEPEFTDTVELAFRSQFNDTRTTFNANLYYTEYDDIQISVTGPLNMFDVEVQNAGSAKLWGLELDFSHQVTPDFEIYSTAAYAHTEFGSFVDRTGNSLDGNAFPNAPEFSATVGALYTFGNGWSVAADTSYTGASYSNAANDFFANGNPATGVIARNREYWLVNAQVTYEFNDRVSVTGYVRNLLNEHYTTSTASLSAFVGPPREFGFFFDAEF